MRNIIFSPLAQDSIIAYISSYRRYFLSLYTDTGIWSEKDILANYSEQAIAREREIFALIKMRLMPDIVQGRHLDNTISLAWRSKILWIQWEDQGQDRVIVNIKIQSQ